MNPNKRAAAQEKHRNLMYAYTSNRLFPPSILTLRIHLIDHDHPSCHPLSSPTHHPCHPPSSSITILITSNIHLTPCLSQGEFTARSEMYVQYSPHPSSLPSTVITHHPSSSRRIFTSSHASPRANLRATSSEEKKQEDFDAAQKRMYAIVITHPSSLPSTRLYRHHTSQILITPNIHPTQRLSQGEFARHLLRREEARRLRRRAKSNVRRRMHM